MRSDRPSAPGILLANIGLDGHDRSEELRTVAQVISEALPNGDKEKQLLQGLLNQRDKVEEALTEGRLFR